MNADFNLCDICGAKCPSDLRIHLTVDRKMDAAGSMDDICEFIDLCHVHALEIVRKSIKRENGSSRYDDHEKATELYKLVQRMRKCATK